MAVDPHPLRVFLQGLVTGRSRTFSDELRNLARAVLGRRAGLFEVDDLLGQFLLRLVEATRRGRVGSAVALLLLSDATIRAAIPHRQVLAESFRAPGSASSSGPWDKAVLDEELPVSPASAPTTLYRATDLAPARGRDAVAWVLAREALPPRTVPAIAARLQGLYFDGDPHRGDEPIQLSVEENVLRGLDAPSSLSTFTTTLVRTSAAWPHSVSAGRS